MPAVSIKMGGSQGRPSIKRERLCCLPATPLFLHRKVSNSDYTMNSSLLLLFSLLLSLGIAAEPIQRSTLIAIKADPVSYDQAALTTVLLDAKALAAKHDIRLIADESAVLTANQNRLTLHAEGLTLDGLLEMTIAGNAMEWKMEGRNILIYTTPERRVAQQKRLNTEIYQKLAQIVVPEIIFDNLSIPEAYALIRAQAIKVAGLGSVPKIDVPFTPSKPKTINLKVTNTSVLTLFDLLTAVSESSIEWHLDRTKIVLFDEAQRREALVQQRIARNKSRFSRKPSSSDADPFSSDDGGYFAPIPDKDPSSPQLSLETESYDYFGDNPFFSPVQEPLSTFSIDVDTASYSNIRRLIRTGARVPVDATRIEELINYFSYHYPPPAKGPVDEPLQGPPFATHLESASSPWSPKHRLVRIGLKGYEIDWSERPPSNLVFLLDVSGSMNNPNKLGLVKDSLRLLVKRLDERDRISIVVYAGSSGLVLPPTRANRKKKILQAIEQLQAGGSTNGGEGIALAYKTARENFNQLGNNRVILCTDGDFNVGTTDHHSLVDLVEEQGRTGVFLTVLGFGSGNIQDDLLETLSNNGNGNYFYIDSKKEARKVFVQDLSGTLVTIAKDVKVQIEFNPAQVGAYRLLGYENRLLEAPDFDDDTKDAGEIGAGHSVTAFYEIVPPDQAAETLRAMSPLKYQKVELRKDQADDSEEMLTLKLRYKEPEKDESKLLTFPFIDSGNSFADASVDFRFAASVASFGMILRDSDYRGDSTVDSVLTSAEEAQGPDEFGYRKEFIELVKKYRQENP